MNDEWPFTFPRAEAEKAITAVLARHRFRRHTGVQQRDGSVRKQPQGCECWHWEGDETGHRAHVASVLADLMADAPTLADAWETQLRRVSFWHHAGLWDASCPGVPTDIHLTPPHQLEAKCRTCGFALVAMDSNGAAIHVPADTEVER